jgi:hypothetical protein
MARRLRDTRRAHAYAPSIDTPMCAWQSSFGRSVTTPSSAGGAAPTNERRHSVAEMRVRSSDSSHRNGTIDDGAVRTDCTSDT